MRAILLVSLCIGCFWCNASGAFALALLIMASPISHALEEETHKCMGPFFESGSTPAIS